MKHRSLFAKAKNVPKNAQCVYCGGRAQVIEHVLPQLKEWTLDWNERYSCVPCNGTKSTQQSRNINTSALFPLLQKYPHLNDVLLNVPVGRESGSDLNYGWYYKSFKPSLLWMGSYDFSVIADVALALYEANTPILNSLGEDWFTPT